MNSHVLVHRGCKCKSLIICSLALSLADTPCQRKKQISRGSRNQTFQSWELRYFNTARCIIAPRGSLLPSPSRKSETLKGSISTLLPLFNYIPAWFWAVWRKSFIGFGFHRLIATQPGSLALRWCQPSPPCTRYTAYKGNQNTSLSEKTAMNILGMRHQGRWNCWISFLTTYELSNFSTVELQQHLGKGRFHCLLVALLSTKFSLYLGLFRKGRIPIS